jgi:hypothetical protein
MIDDTKGKRQSRERSAISAEKKKNMAMAMQSGQTPLEFLLQIMNDDEFSQRERIEAARAAAPYCHPKLSAVDVNATIGVSHEDALDELD